MPTITQSTDPFFQTKCNTKMFYSKDANDNFTIVNCYDVLKNLLMHWGARIIYWKHIYYIVQIQEYNTAESGVFGFSNGGLVTGPTLGLIGEGAGTTASNPEVIAPLDKLKGMIGGGSQKVEVYGRISGNDIFLATRS